jgi:hypothetical protein
MFKARLAFTPFALSDVEELRPTLSIGDHCLSPMAAAISRPSKRPGAKLPVYG